MSMILVGKNDISIGQPLPWQLFDQQHRLLAEQGEIVRDGGHLDNLLSSGAYRELAWDTPDGDNGGSRLSAAAAAPEASGADGLNTQFTFDDMKLKVESRLQLEPPNGHGSSHP